MLDFDQPHTPALNSLARLFRVFQSAVFVALLYSIAAFVFGWVLGGPDRVDGVNLFSPTCLPISSSKLVLGVIQYSTFLLMLLLLYQFSPKSNAPLTRLAQRRGLIIGLVVLGSVLVIVWITFAAAYLASGCSFFLKDLSIIVLSGVFGGGFLQLMSAAVVPNPESKLEKRLLYDLKEKARQRAAEMGLDPEIAAEESEKIWNNTGRDIGWIMEKAYGLVSAIASAGVHGGLIFVLGVAFFIGLGFGVSSPTASLLYLIPLLIALADTSTLLTFQAFMRRVEGRKKPASAAAVSLPIAVLGIIYKVVLIVAGSAAIAGIGGPEIPWHQYWQTAQAEPFSRGLTASAMLLSSVAWPALLFVGPSSRELEV